MNWLLRQWDFRILISLINDISIVLSLKIPRSVFFCSGNFSFSALLFHKLLFQGIKFSVFDTSVNKNLGGGQNLERPNVERPIFRKFETSNIEITKVKLFDFSIFEFILYFYDCLNYSNTQNTYLIIYHKIRNFSNVDSFTNGRILKNC